MNDPQFAIAKVVVSIDSDRLPHGVTAKDVILALDVTDLTRAPLKLYVWNQVFRDYTTGIAVALAHDAEEARQMIVEQMGYAHEDLANSPQVFDPQGEPVAFYVYGGD